MISWPVRLLLPIALLAVSVLSHGCRAAYGEASPALPVSGASARATGSAARLASAMEPAHFRAWAREQAFRAANTARVRPSRASSRPASATSSSRDALAEREPELLDEDEGALVGDERVELNPLRCRGWRQRRAEAPLGECAQPMVDRVLAWRPDALVILGGGLQLNGEANCATAERGYIAAQLFVALEARPLLVFSGHASRWIRRRVDAADVRCINARIAQGALGRDVPQWARDQREPAEDERYSVSEAESMCAVVLRALPEAMHSAVLERARFDVRARDTFENAKFTREFLVAAEAQRALVVTSPYINPSTWRYYPHADRALTAFRRVRRDGGYALAALACPRTQRRDPWFEFEPVDGYDGHDDPDGHPSLLRSRDLSSRVTSTR